MHLKTIITFDQAIKVMHNLINQYKLDVQTAANLILFNTDNKDIYFIDLIKIFEDLKTN